MIPEIKKILFATDLSQKSRYAFDYAASIASLYKAGIVLLYVTEELSPSAESMIAGFLDDKKMEELKNAHQTDAQKALIGKKRDGIMLENALDSFSKEIQSEFAESDHVFATDEIVLKNGNAAEEIINQAKSYNCDLIVMAYKSRSMLVETIVGGTTRRVLRRSTVPVLLVPMPEE